LTMAAEAKNRAEHDERHLEVLVQAVAKIVTISWVGKISSEERM